MNSHKSPSGVLGDFVDGERFKNSPLFAEDNCALQIQLYYDELELCNPLGRKAKKHKIGVDLITKILAFVFPINLICSYINFINFTAFFATTHTHIGFVCYYSTCRPS